MNYRKITIDLELGDRIKHLEIDNEIELKEYYEMKNRIDKLQRENDSLKRQINELEKYLEDKNSFFKISTMGYSYGVVKDILDKLKELKVSGNNG